MAISSEQAAELLATLLRISERLERLESLESLFRLYIEREAEQEARWKRAFAALSIIANGDGSYDD